MDPTECYWVLLCAFCLVGLLPNRTVICDDQLIGSGVTSNQSNVGSHHSGYEHDSNRRTFNVKGRTAKYCTMNQLFCIPGNYSK